MARTGMAVLAAVGLAVVGGGAWMLASSDALASQSGSPAVLIDEPASKARYELIDIAYPDDLKEINDEVERVTGRAPIRLKKNDDGAQWRIELDETDFLLVTVSITEVSAKKSELNVNVKLPGSPFTDDWGLQPGDVRLIEDALDVTLTEHIAAKLEGRPVDSTVQDHFERKLELGNFLQLAGFEKRLAGAYEGAIKPILERYEEEARRRQRSNYSRDDNYTGQEDWQSRAEQSQASAPSSSAAPTTYLPSN